MGHPVYYYYNVIVKRTTVVCLRTSTFSFYKYNSKQSKHKQTADKTSTDDRDDIHYTDSKNQVQRRQRNLNRHSIPMFIMEHNIL